MDEFRVSFSSEKWENNSIFEDEHLPADESSSEQSRENRDEKNQNEELHPDYNKNTQTISSLEHQILQKKSISRIRQKKLTGELPGL